ncbi:hypothetical protein HXP44_31930 [Streptomyces sioyaensis]|uniref:Uncharacterized protein n=1 Tax=Streptomyces sioyaensis TaxID=67364 RepID=A0A4Q1QP52_9ACTN|nr:hypothetical protein [Streptomyces sioyaensis]MBM4796519.1 hypothetical protein [Streptomyces sioyaensis]RXS62752.1 hypothetical protein EST54_25065 [Streptomyces sioyaensis]
MGTASPAAAADEQKPIDNAKIYSSEDEITARMAGTDGQKGWAPVADSESVMGYPKGIDRDKDNKVKPVYRDDVQTQYDPKQAVVDAKAAARKFAEDTTNHPAPLREVAKQLADSTLTDPFVTKDTNDDKLFAKGTEGPAEDYCAGKMPKYAGEPPQNDAKANPCVFVGKLDKKAGSKYPKVDGGSGIAGGGKKTYSVEIQSTEEDSTTSGWSAGGKLTTKVTSTPAGDKGGATPELSGEASFTYSYSSTTTNKVMTSQKDQTEVEFPSDKKGSLQGRRDGAYYIGWIIARKVNHKILDDNAGQEQLVAIPARVYVQSPQSSTSVTYFKYQE